MPFPLPPRRIHPDSFFLEYLPSLWKILSGGVLMPDWEFEVEVCLQNKSGVQRTYSLHIFDEIHVDDSLLINIYRPSECA